MDKCFYLMMCFGCDRQEIIAKFSVTRIFWMYSSESLRISFSFPTATTYFDQMIVNKITNIAITVFCHWNFMNVLDKSWFHIGNRVDLCRKQMSEVWAKGQVCLLSCDIWPCYCQCEREDWQKEYWILSQHRERGVCFITHSCCKF